VAFAGLLLISTICGYTFYTTGLRHLQASVGSITAQAEVPFAAFWGYAILGERMDSWQLLGALIVMGGVILLSLQTRGGRSYGKKGPGVREDDAHARAG
jgi:drug/metabolite transporter (DMT)-like permease